GYSDNILVKLFISEIVHTKDSILLKLYYKFNFATEPIALSASYRWETVGEKILRNSVKKA
uniref:hypothetical protein n=2 Tax=Staphylococcus epidermidis TaxID=1282 RepID=UPI00066ECA38